MSRINELGTLSPMNEAEREHQDKTTYGTIRITRLPKWLLSESSSRARDVATELARGPITNSDSTEYINRVDDLIAYLKGLVKK